MEAPFIALLGRPDAPTDGVADYCDFLAQAFARRDFPLQIRRVPWAERGWTEALRELDQESASWSNARVLLQYTALSWSRRGFPFGAVRAVRVLRRRRVPCTVVFHDGAPSAGKRIRDRVRHVAQTWTLRNLFEQADQGIFTTMPETLPWVPKRATRATFIPIGANIPECRARRVFDSSSRPRIVAVFSVTIGQTQAREVMDIALALRQAAQRIGPVRLDVFGRGATEASALLENALQGTRVDLRVRGVIPAEEITQTLASSDASLCVRGLTTSNRGTSIASIACGVPLVGYGTQGRDPAIDAAGVRLAPWHEPQVLAQELVDVLTDAALWQQLHERNLEAQERYFSWDVIAEKYLRAHATIGDQAA